jgi:hypothetical protein
MVTVEVLADNEEYKEVRGVQQQQAEAAGKACSGLSGVDCWAVLVQHPAAA